MDNIIYSSNTVVSNLPVGVKSVFYKDSKGCLASENITINEPSPLALVVDSFSSISCFGSADAEIYITTNGGTPNISSNYSVNFDGFNDFIEIPQGDAFYGSSGDFTISSWVKVNQFNGSQEPIFESNIQNELQLMIVNNNGRLTLNVGGGLVAESLPLNWNLNEWYYVTVINSSGTPIFYRNGNILGVTYFNAGNINSRSFTSLNLGKDDQTNNFYLDGSLDDFSYFDIALSQQEVQNQMMCSLSGNEPNLLSYWNFDEGSGITLIDLTSNGNNGNINGSSYSIDVPSPSCGGINTSYSFSWNSPNSGFTSSLEDLSSISQSGTYYCTVTDANSCAIYSLPINITEPAEITENISDQDVSCFGASDGTISLVINGGNAPYTVDWTGPSSIPQQNSFPYFLNQLAPGSYNFTITDSKGCSSATNPSIILVQPADITISVLNGPVTCYDGSDGALNLSVSNIINPSFEWTSNDPNFYQTTEDISSLPQGVYSVVVTDAITGCTKSLSQAVQIVTPYNVVTFKNDETCFGENDGSINIVPNSIASYSYNWLYPDASTSTSQNVSNGVPGSYQLTISYTQANAAGVLEVCPVPYTFFIMPAPEILVSASPSLVSCEGGNDGSIGLSVSGGTPFLNNSYSYLWSNMQTTKDIINLPTGLYSVTVLDQNNCSLDTSFTLNSLTFDTTLVVIVPVACKGESTASVDISVTGGVYPYNFLWSNIATGFTSTSEDVLNILAGSYWLDVSDASGCTITRSISVSEPSSSLNTFVFDVDSSTCNGLSDGSVELQTNGGMSPYTSDWAGANPDSLLSGMYTYKVTDANGCEILDSIFVYEPDPILIIPTVIDVDCPNKSTGSISILISGAVSSLSTIDWIGPQDPITNQPFLGSGLSINNLKAGNYTCIVTNENGCVSQLDVPLSEPAADPGYEIWKQSKYSGWAVSCNGGSDGWLKIDYIDGIYAPYSFLWDNGDNNDSIYGLSADTFNVVMTDALGCTKPFRYVLDDPDSIVSFTYLRSDLNGYNVSCYDSNDGYITASALGGVGDYSYKWYKNDTLLSSFIQNSIYNLEAANYYLTVTDGNDCSFSDTITIVQPDSVYFILKTATDTCSLQKGYAEVSAFGGAMGYQYFWSTGDLLNYVDTLSQGTYSISINDANLCESSQSFDISNLPSPIADFSLNPSYQKLAEQLENPFVFIDNSETFSQSIDTWTWQLSDRGVLLSVLTDSISEYSFDAVGDYVALLTIQTEFNCVDTISKKLKVDNYSLWIPTAFTPNNDDKNDVFKPKWEGVKQFRMKIYSRWGGLVFESDDIQYGWDGLDNTNNILPGVYTYYIEVVSIFNEVYTYEGVFNLIR
jgi:gliding motility-associated-like protein